MGFFALFLNFGWIFMREFWARIKPSGNRPCDTLIQCSFAFWGTRAQRPASIGFPAALQIFRSRAQIYLGFTFEAHAYKVSSISFGSRYGCDVNCWHLTLSA